ncbi:hypothetical protein D3C80_731700 [compost metagenome]
MNAINSQDEIFAKISVRFLKFGIKFSINMNLSGLNNAFFKKAISIAFNEITFMKSSSVNGNVASQSSIYISFIRLSSGF